MTQLRWWTSGIVAVTLIALAVFVLSPDDAVSVPSRVAVVSDLSADSSALTSDVTALTTTSATDTAVSAAVSGDADSSSEVTDSVGGVPENAASGSTDGDSSASSASSASAGTATDTTTATETTLLSQTPTVSSASAAGVAKGPRLRIPSLGVDALVVELGYDADGQLDVPADAYSVGWYSISAKPGEAGNALLGGHLNWQGLRGVFDRLDELNDGDLIYLVQNGEELVFQVSRSRSVSANASLGDVLSTTTAGSTLTLFTCGGTFDQGAGEYDQRLVVSAVRVANGAG